jgi:hypothetical protein
MCVAGRLTVKQLWLQKTFMVWRSLHTCLAPSLIKESGCDSARSLAPSLRKSFSSLARVYPTETFQGTPTWIVQVQPASAAKAPRATKFIRTDTTKRTLRRQHKASQATTIR